MTDPIDVLDFWLGEIGPDGWFNGGDAVDQACRSLFSDLWSLARDGKLEHWVDGSVNALAYLIVTDQFPRNLFRGSPDAFATDAKALAVARKSVEAGWDVDWPEPDRMFFYLPFEHSEDPADQVLGVTYMAERLSSDPDMALHARVHQHIIGQFGRFPFRNAALGRTSTQAEEAFMRDGGYAAAVAAFRASHAPGA
jgi:uncharacterized protein (DUF924 family)